MEISFVMADPAGNRTALVLSPVPPQQRAALSARLMGLPALGAEQVGFLCPPRAGGQLRLEMMGGEFCGNAARSAGLLFACRQGGGPQQVLLEASGAPDPVPVLADPSAGRASARMPLPVAPLRLRAPSGLLEGYDLGGILHLLLPGQRRSRPVFDQILQLALRQWPQLPALGVMFLPAPGQLEPMVYVAQTGTTVPESSCGSGTVAAALFACRGQCGQFSFSFSQPGGVIEAQVLQDGGIPRRVSIGGTVTLSPVQQLPL